MAFFPSYRFMEDVFDVFQESGQGIDALVQSQYMGEQEREEFLKEFEMQRENSLVAFCVMGGVFSEGTDLTEDRLIGAIVIGTGLPQVCNDREIVRKYFDDRDLRGFDYAYLYPGMNKVLQSAGRVIRTENDRGVILLLDDRFLTRQYRELFPREWKGYQTCGIATMKEQMKRFWSRQTEMDTK